MSDKAPEQEVLGLFDVDGVFNPEEITSKEAGRRGYRTSRHARHHLARKVRYNPAHGVMVSAWALRERVSPTWCTYWGPDVYEYIEPALHIPRDLRPWPLVDFGTQTRWEYVNVWKYPAVLAYAAGRALVWFDDEHYARPSLRERFLAARAQQRAPTLLVDVNPAYGLDNGHLVEASEWLDVVRSGVVPASSV